MAPFYASCPKELYENKNKYYLFFPPSFFLSPYFSPLILLFFHFKVHIFVIIKMKDKA